MLVRQNPPALAVSSAPATERATQHALPTVARDRQLSEFPPLNPEAHTTNTVDYAIGHHGPSPHLKSPLPPARNDGYSTFWVEVPGAGRSPGSVIGGKRNSNIRRRELDRALWAVNDLLHGSAGRPSAAANPTWAGASPSVVRWDSRPCPSRPMPIAVTTSRSNSIGYELVRI
jgi:hypothetical protein